MKTILALALLVSASAVTAKEGDMWINVHFAAHHSVDKYWDLESESWEQYNNVNPGLGLEYELSNNLSTKAGFYKNSINATTVYAGGNVHTAYGDGISVGLNFGLATGYEAEHGLMIVPVVMPNINFEYGGLRMEVGVLPGIGKYTTVYAFTVGAQF